MALLVTSGNRIGGHPRRIELVTVFSGWNGACNSQSQFALGLRRELINCLKDLQQRRECSHAEYSIVSFESVHCHPTLSRGRYQYIPPAEQPWGLCLQGSPEKQLPHAVRLPWLRWPLGVELGRVCQAVLIPPASAHSQLHIPCL